MADSRVTDALARTPLFAGVPAKTLKRIAAVTELRDAAAGEAIVTEGRGDRHCCVLISGHVAVPVRGRKRDELGPGDFFGELAILARSSRTATVTAVSATRLAVIDARDFVALVESEPKVALYLLNALARRFEWVTRRPAGEHR
jgi:CRP-like cAMP-binding protein